MLMNDKIIRTGLNYLKEQIAKFFDIDESFVDISAAWSAEQDIKKYRFELKLNTTGNNLRTFNLSVYTFYLDTIDEDRFTYENHNFTYNEMNSFLNMLAVQIKELDK